jgi:hypothetical protein
MSKYKTRHDYVRENTVDWLKDFADKQGEKIAKDNNIDPAELKNAGYMDNILDIVNRKKQVSVEEKVAKYRELVGMDAVENMAKEGGNEPKQVTASRISLSIRDKVAQEEADPARDKKLMDNIKQYVDQIVVNRNGSIATPAILDQLESYMKVDKEWLREHLEQIEDMVAGAREKVLPETHELPINELARTDEPSKGEKEAPPFLPPATSGN